MKRVLLAMLLVLPACEDEAPVSAAPPPQALTREAVGHFCGMVVQDHPGPKAQVIVKSREQPYWFTSVRDAKAFTLLPDQPKDVVAVYVSDMARTDSWDSPAPSWMPADAGWFVVGSSRMGGMGQPEAVPFSTADAAQAFAARHGGEVLRWDAIPKDYVLGGHG